MPADIWPTVAKTTVIREPIKTPPAPLRVRIYAKDGSSMEVYQIDAKEVVAGGEYSYEPFPAAEIAAAEAVDQPPVVSNLDTLKKDELVELAESKGIDTKGMTKADLVNALEAGG